jgi:hypothetical protein
MDAEAFAQLALRVLAREATEGERRALAGEISADPAREEQFRQIKITHDILRMAAPMAAATQARDVELPAHRLNELRTAVRQHFGPAANRDRAAAPSGPLRLVLRWLLGGGAAAVLGVIVVSLCFADRTVEIGFYQTDRVRGDNSALAPSDVPTARLVTFDHDAPFDQWQVQPLAWYEHAKIWIDNEHDLLHIVRRAEHGQVVVETEPLAATNEAQRAQIQRVIAALKK